MPPKEVSIVNLKPNMESWRAKLTISEVFPPLVEAYTLQKFVFADAEDKQIEGIIWGETNINKISAGLRLYSVYAIGVKKIDIVKPPYKLVDNEYQLVITPNDYCNRIENQHPSLQSLANDIISFDDLVPLIDTQTPINVLAVIVDCGVTVDTKNGKTRWLKVITKERKLLLFTLWDEYATYHGPELDLYKQDFPIIVAKRAIVHSFHTVSLSTRRRRTSIGINPPIEQAYILKSWFLGIKDSLSSQLLSSTEVHFTRELAQTDNKNLYSLAHIQNEQMAGQYLVKASIQCISSKRMFFIACKFCKTSVNNADIGEELQCGACHRRTVLIPRVIINLELEDSTAKMTLPALGETAEELIGTNANELAQQYTEGKKFDLNSLNEKLRHKLYHIKVIRSILQTTGKRVQQQRTTIASIFEVDETDKTKELMSFATSPQKSVLDVHDTEAAEGSSSKASLLEKSIDVGLVQTSSKRSLDLQIAEEEEDFHKKIKATTTESAKPSSSN